MYTGSKAKVPTSDGEREPFEILVKVLQENTLAPYLFIIAFDYTLRQALDDNKEELGFHLKKSRICCG